jgi:rfaE bifunctional protein nucleotidyltransferase chain/domain
MMTVTSRLTADFYAPRFDNKVVSRDQLNDYLALLPRPFIFTNGCFDLLHRGHVSYLDQAAQLGQAKGSLIVGINSDASVRRLGKGAERPLNAEQDRAHVIAALGCVALVTIFEEDTPLSLIHQIRPDKLVKGGDWAIEHMVGATEVLAWGGSVHRIPFLYDTSTTQLVLKIRGAC